MRVIAGTARGVKLFAPPGMDVTRPTADRAREALFNILQNQTRGAAVLDLFAGSGAVGVEALSRGAARAVFVDNSPAACAMIRQNLEKTRLSDRAEVLQMPCDRALALLRARGERFHLIYADPPYHSSLARIPARDFLAGGGVFVAETAAGEAFECADVYDTRRYGAAMLHFIGDGD